MWNNPLPPLGGGGGGADSYGRSRAPTTSHPSQPTSITAAHKVTQLRNEKYCPTQTGQSPDLVTPLYVYSYKWQHPLKLPIVFNLRLDINVPSMVASELLCSSCSKVPLVFPVGHVTILLLFERNASLSLVPRAIGATQVPRGRPAKLFTTATKFLSVPCQKEQLLLLLAFIVNRFSLGYVNSTKSAVQRPIKEVQFSLSC